MNDVETNKRALDCLGIEKAKALAKIYGAAPCYPSAIVNVWRDEQIEEGLNNNEAPADIAERVGVHIKRVARRRNRLFGFKSKKRIPRK